MSEQISLEQAFKDATTLAEKMIELAGGMESLKGLLEGLGLNPDGGKSEQDKALDLLVRKYLNDFVESGLISVSSLSRH